MPGATVERGDSYFSLAERIYGDQRMAVELMKANGGKALHPGMTIGTVAPQSDPVISEGDWGTMQSMADDGGGGGAGEEEDRSPGGPGLAALRRAEDEIRRKSDPFGGGGTHDPYNPFGGYTYGGDQSTERDYTPLRAQGPGYVYSYGGAFDTGGGGSDGYGMSGAERSYATRYGITPAVQMNSGQRGSSFAAGEQGSYAPTQDYVMRASAVNASGQSLVSATPGYDTARTNTGLTLAQLEKQKKKQSLVAQQQQQRWDMQDKYMRNARRFLDSLATMDISQMPVTIDMMTANFAGFSVGQLLEMGYEQVEINSKGQIIYRLKVPITPPGTTPPTTSSAGGGKPRRYYSSGGGGGGGYSRTGRSSISAISNGLINWRIG